MPNTNCILYFFHSFSILFFPFFHRLIYQDYGIYHLWGTYSLLYTFHAGQFIDTIFIAILHHNKIQPSMYLLRQYCYTLCAHNLRLYRWSSWPTMDILFSPSLILSLSHRCYCCGCSAIAMGQKMSIYATQNVSLPECKTVIVLCVGIGEKGPSHKI